MAKKSFKVTFPDSRSLQDDSQLLRAELLTNDLLRVHLGIVKCSHKYEAHVLIPNEVASVRLSETVGDENCKVVGSSQNPLGTVLLLEVTVGDVSTFEACVKLKTEDVAKVLTVTAAVLGPDKGTPLLKNGMHVLNR